MRSKWVEVLRPEIWEVVLGEEEALEMGGKESEDGRKAEDWQVSEVDLSWPLTATIADDFLAWVNRQPIHLHLLDPPPPPSTIPMLKPKHNRRSPSSSPPALTRPDPLDECRPSSVALSIFVRPPTPPTDSNNTSTILRHGELDELELGDLDFEIGTTILPLAGGVAGAEELQGLLVLI
jgi:hypothetical protein